MPYFEMEGSNRQEGKTKERTIKTVKEKLKK